MMRRDVDQITIVAVEGGEPSIAQPRGTLHDRVEHGLQIRARATDDTEDLGRRRLLLEGLRQALLELACPGAFGLLRCAGDRSRRFGLSLRGLYTPAHRSLLGSHRRDDRTAADDSLG